MTRNAWHRTALLAGLCATCAADARAQSSDGSNAGLLLRLFTDSGHITVRSAVQDWTVPLGSSAQLGVHWNNEQVTVPGVSAPPGSREAVDAITTASRPIAGNPYQPFRKQRNELTGDLAAGAASASYYVSSEADYFAQQLGASVHRGFRDDQFDVAVGSSYGWDDIRPLANGAARAAEATKTTLHCNAVATGILSPTTLVRGGVEVDVVRGLQHNPYRNVYAGGIYVPERHPDRRDRRDAFVRVNQYLADRASVKLAYRFYDDDWGVASHELGATLSQYVTHGAAIAWEYRWYTQSHADFWRGDYASSGGVSGYRTGDSRLGDLASHLFGTSLRLDFAHLAPAHRVLARTGAWLNYERYFNSNEYSADILEAGLDYHFR